MRPTERDLDLWIDAFAVALVLASVVLLALSPAGGPGTVVALVAALMVPGVAVTALLPRVSLMQRLGIGAGISLAVDIGVSLGMIWSHWWHPGAAAAVVGWLSLSAIGAGVTWPPPWLEAPAQGAARVTWPPPWLEAAAQRAAQLSADRRPSSGWDDTPAWDVQKVSELREHVRELLERSDERERQSRARLRERGTLGERPVEAGAVHRLLALEELAILDLIEEWAPVDRSHQKLAHRGSYTGSVFVSPSTVRRVALKHRITVPGAPPRPPRRKLVFPEVPWERNRIWMWEDSLFPTAGRVAYAIVDVVTRYWTAYLLASEESHAQVPLLFASALEEQGLHDGGATPGTDSGPILVAWSDNDAEMIAAGGPTATAHVESFFGLLKGEWPDLTLPSDPDALDQELARVRDEYNTVRLHAAVGYVTPSDQHHGRGPQIRRARDDGLRRARAERLQHNWRRGARR